MIETTTASKFPHAERYLGRKQEYSASIHHALIIIATYKELKWKKKTLSRDHGCPILLDFLTFMLILQGRAAGPRYLGRNQSLGKARFFLVEQKCFMSCPLT